MSSIVVRVFKRDIERSKALVAQRIADLKQEKSGKVSGSDKKEEVKAQDVQAPVETQGS